MNSPNDVVERADGTVWFTDPSYGIDTDYEGDRADSEIGGCYVFRIDPDGAVEVVADDFVRPNGLAFSADESQLYVVDTRARHIRRFDVSARGELTGGEVFADAGESAYDGVRLDEVGRLWVAAEDGIHCFDPDGTLAREAPPAGDRVESHVRRREAQRPVRHGDVGRLHAAPERAAASRYPT